jgi:hypothetical protein
MHIRSRPRHFLPPNWLRIARVAFRYSYLYNVYVPRLVGAERGPILIAERRQQRERRRRRMAISRRERRFMPRDRRRAVTA